MTKYEGSAVYWWACFEADATGACADVVVTLCYLELLCSVGLCFGAHRCLGFNIHWSVISLSYCGLWNLRYLVLF